jgi:hypothetical protein
MKRKWHYLENQFLSTTKYNFKKAVKLRSPFGKVLFRFTI